MNNVSRKKTSLWKTEIEMEWKWNFTDYESEGNLQYRFSRRDKRNKKSIVILNLRV